MQEPANTPSSEIPQLAEDHEAGRLETYLPVCRVNAETSTQGSQIVKVLTVLIAVALSALSSPSMADGRHGAGESANLRLVKHMVKSYEGGDMGAVMSLLSDDVTIHLTVAEGTPLSGIFKGRDGVNQYFERNAQTMEPQSMEVNNFLAGGSQVAVIGRETIKVKRSGELMQDADWVMLCTVRNGKITSIEVIEDTAVLSRAYR